MKSSQVFKTEMTVPPHEALVQTTGLRTAHSQTNTGHFFQIIGEAAAG